MKNGWMDGGEATEEYLGLGGGGLGCLYSCSWMRVILCSVRYEKLIFMKPTLTLILVGGTRKKKRKTLHVVEYRVCTLE